LGVEPGSCIHTIAKNVIVLDDILPDDCGGSGYLDGGIS
jgi:hypothetical protein